MKSIHTFGHLGAGAFAFLLVAALFLSAAHCGQGAQCDLDWDADGSISEADYLVGSPMGGFYAEWYIYLYYPSYYVTLFPGRDVARLDFNNDDVFDELDLMGPLDPALPTEGFYVEWYIFMFYPTYFPIFMPEVSCPCPSACLSTTAVLFCEFDGGSVQGGYSCDDGGVCCIPREPEPCPDTCVADLFEECLPNGGVYLGAGCTCPNYGFCCQLP